jgi:hypothetical protein
MTTEENEILAEILNRVKAIEKDVKRIKEAYADKIAKEEGVTQSEVLGRADINDKLQDDLDDLNKGRTFS